MDQTVDLDSINDINQLKAMAYDQIAAKEHAESNLRNVNTRIAQLKQQSDKAEA